MVVRYLSFLTENIMRNLGDEQETAKFDIRGHQIPEIRYADVLSLKSQKACNS